MEVNISRMKAQAKKISSITLKAMRKSETKQKKKPKNFEKNCVLISLICVNKKLKYSHKMWKEQKTEITIREIAQLEQFNLVESSCVVCGKI